MCSRSKPDRTPRVPAAGCQSDRGERDLAASHRANDTGVGNVIARRWRRTVAQSPIHRSPQAEMLHSATSLLGVLAVPLVGQEILQRCQKGGTELAPLGINLRQVIFFQKAAKVSLRKILCVLFRVSASANTGIKRTPMEPVQCR